MRPLGLTEILDESFGLYRKRFGLLFGIALIPNVVVGLLTAFMSVQMASTVPGDFTQLMVMLMFSMILLLVAYLGAEVGNAAMTSAISEGILGRMSTLGSSYRRVGRRL